ncbi:MAG TPA: FAD-dependent oxidoreductase [Candidatus Baltobacteraceae bacterium]|nr:FAD-dependent oxidoreductase [Candidatus Baltobacteraceae bacterium]
MPKQTFAVVGAGVAAASAAMTLRESGFDGRLVMIGAERDLPYNRPTLSKERLRGEISDEQTLLHPPADYESKDIEVLLEHRVQHVGVAENLITFSDGATLAYDRALLATGARVRKLDAPGGDLPGVHYLRSLRDCSSIADVLKKRPRVLVLGTGFIGCEVAASARSVGCEVTLAGRGAPLAHVLGPEIGDIYAQYHRTAGVTVRIGTSVERFEGAGRLESARLSDGTRVECDLAVIGIGVEPALDVLHGEPIETGNGVLVSEFGQSSVPSVFAAGDVAHSWNPRYGTRLRVEHFDNAQRQAVVVAKAMLGPTEPYNPIPSFWSDQFSYGLQYRGYAPSWDAIIYRGDTAGGSFSAFYLKGGALQAVCSVNRYKENSAARRLIGKHVDPAVLADDHADLKEVQA